MDATEKSRKAETRRKGRETHICTRRRFESRTTTIDVLLIHARERKKSWGWVINTTRRRRLLGQTMEKQPTHGLKTEREKRESVCVCVCVCVCHKLNNKEIKEKTHTHTHKRLRTDRDSDLCWVQGGGRMDE